MATQFARDTEVPVAKTRGEIEDLLSRHHADQFGYTMDKNEARIGADVPAIMADYEPCDMQEGLWCYRYPHRGTYFAVEVDGFMLKVTSKDPNNVLRALHDDTAWNGGCRKLSGELIQRPLAEILSRAGIVIYTSYPDSYRLVLRDAGERP